MKTLNELKSKELQYKKLKTKQVIVEAKSMFINEAEQGDYKSDPKELVDMVYDTLLKNTQYPLLDLDKIEDQEVDRGTGIITFLYDSIPVKILVKIG